jgi:hypothetical protein
LKSKFLSCAICGGENLTGFLDGMLDGETMRKVDAHVRECVVCRENFRQLEETRVLLRGSKQTFELPGASFWADTYRRARLEGSIPEQGKKSYMGFRRRISLLAISATLAAVLGLTLLVSSPVGNPGGNFSARQSVDQVDVWSLISAHADYVAGKRLSDGSNNRIIRSDLATQTIGESSLAPTDVASIESVPNGTTD